MCVCLHDMHVKECVGTEAGECWIGGGMARRLCVVKGAGGGRVCWGRMARRLCAAKGIRGGAGGGRVCWDWLRWSVCFEGEVPKFMGSRMKIALCEAR